MCINYDKMPDEILINTTNAVIPIGAKCMVADMAEEMARRLCKKTIRANIEMSSEFLIFVADAAEYNESKGLINIISPLDS